jgi:predicted GNAT superfamily acetyltransferase
MLFLGQPQPTGFFFAFHKRTAVFFSKRPRADVRLGKPVSFKLGYRAEDGSLYSWLAGVLPAQRMTGLAQWLLEAQEAWAGAHGFAAIPVKSMNRAC